MRKLCINARSGFPISMDDRFRLIKAAGFDGVILGWGKENPEVEGDRKKQPELAGKYGLFVENIHLPNEGVNCLWTDTLDGDEYEKMLAGYIDDCYNLGIPAAVFHHTQTLTPPPFGPIGLDRCKRLVESAEKKNVTIAVENIDRPDYLDFLLSNIDSKHLGFCYDSGHENYFVRDRDFLPQYGSRLAALHLHDNDGTKDQHLLPGEGKLDWNSITQKLKASGYSGPLTLEVSNNSRQSAGLETPESFLKKAYEAVQTVFAGLID